MAKYTDLAEDVKNLGRKRRLAKRFWIFRPFLSVYQAVLNYRIDKVLKLLDPQDIVRVWIKYDGVIKIDEDKIAQHIKPSDLLPGLIAGLLESEKKYSELSIDLAKYSIARKKNLAKKTSWSLLKTILTGIFIIPLFFTVPAHKALLHKQKKKELLINAHDSYFAPLRNLQNVDLVKLCGKLIEENKVEQANCYFYYAFEYFLKNDHQKLWKLLRLTENNNMIVNFEKLNKFKDLIAKG